MRFFAFLFIILVLLMPMSAQACIPEPLEEPEQQKLADEAYFIGLVRGEYIEFVPNQRFSSRIFKEIRLSPFAVYVSSPDMNFKDEIVISGEGSWTSCGADLPQKHEIKEVWIVKENGKLKLKRTDVLMGDFIHKLRQNMRYVGVE